MGLGGPTAVGKSNGGSETAQIERAENPVSRLVLLLALVPPKCYYCYQCIYIYMYIYNVFIVKTKVAAT